jgi:hypothetical protein
MGNLYAPLCWKTFIEVHGFHDPAIGLALCLRQGGMPDIKDHHHPRFGTVVPGLMFDRIIELKDMFLFIDDFF